jgi:hypothetical protein
MASAARSAADRLNVWEGTRAPTASPGGSRENFCRGIADPIYRTRSEGAIPTESRFHAAERAGNGFRA